MYRRQVEWACAFGFLCLLRAMCSYAAEPEVAASTAVAAQPAASSVGDDIASIASFIDWRLAPIRWSGAFGTGLRLSGGTDQARRFQDVETANIQGRSYIWQPWFAQFSAGLGLVTSLDRVSSRAGDANGATAASSRNTSTTHTGNLGLNLLPVSRFPFQFTYDISDSRASGELTGNDFQRRHLGLRQNYRPLTGNTNYVVGYDRNTLNSASFGADTVSALNGGVTHSWNTQNVDVNASRTRNTRSNTGESSLISRLNARHGYRPDGTLSLDTQASYSGSDLHLLSSGLAADIRSRFLQLNSVGTWRPEEDHPLYVVGSARLFQNSFSSGNSNSDSTSLGGNIAANYRWTPQTTIYGTFGLTQAANDIGSTLLTSQATGINYTPDPINFGAYRYSWYAGGNVANQTGGSEGARNNVGGNIGQNLTRGIQLKSSTTLSLSAGQSYSLNRDSVASLAQTLSHTATVALRTSPTLNSNASVSATAADSRTYGVNENTFQIINIQTNGQIQFGRYSYGSASLTLQGTRQYTLASPASDFIFNTSGNLTYSHTRAFDIPLLRYTLIYSGNQNQFQSRLLGDINAPREQISHSLEQRLDYNIGRIELRLSARIAHIDDRDDWLIFFTLNRRIGEY